jgi:hypothetical protein
VPASYVLGTDVVVAALRSDRGASRQLLLAALNRQFELLLSVPLILEYEAVMTRPQHLAASGLSGAEVGHVLDDGGREAGSTCVPMAAKAIRS